MVRKIISEGISNAASLAVTLVASAVLIAIGMVYFIVTLFIIKFGSMMLGYTPDANWAVLAAAILSLGSMIGSSIKK